MSGYREPDNHNFEINEPREDYDLNRDFMSLEAWKKAREVKLLLNPNAAKPQFRASKFNV